MTEIRYCKTCKQDTRHDTFKDGLQIGKKQPTLERLFFGMATLGMTELFTDRYRAYKSKICPMVEYEE